MNWPKAFKAEIEVVLGKEYNDFFDTLTEKAATSIRFNPRKLAAIPEGFDQVPWYDRAIYLPERPKFTLDPLFHAGAYYVQEASSMILAHALSALVDFSRPLKVLDLAAAPGGKSTLLADLLSDDSLLLANEVIKSRYQVLRQNLIKWGSPNTITSNHDAAGLQSLGQYFDIILVDAPCSGEGLFRKNPAAVDEWSAEQVAHCSARQKKILSDTVALLKPGGLLVYSTCTYNRQENEENARWLCQKFSFEHQEISMPASWKVQKRDMGYQLYPHRLQGEGFYFACFKNLSQTTQTTDTTSRKNKRKKQKQQDGFWKILKHKESVPFEEWLAADQAVTLLQSPREELIAVPENLLEDTLYIHQKLKRVHIGTPLGTQKKQQLVPAHEWSLSILRNRDIPAYEPELIEVLQFLKKNTLQWPNTSRGWQLVSYQGLALGWIKGLGNRVNNYYPSSWRILMQIPDIPKQLDGFGYFNHLTTKK